MKIAVVDDEKKWRTIVLKYLQAHFCAELPQIDLYESGEEFLKNNKKYELVFMDIEMNGENGFDISSQYLKCFPYALIIILTTHTELSRIGYRINAFRYIDKLHLEELEEALCSAEKKLQREKKISMSIVNFGLLEISYKNIIYFESIKHNVIMNTINGKYECREGISKLTDSLQEEGFYLIHRAYLVNMDHVRNIEPKGITMDTGEVLCISRRRYVDFREQFIKWKMERGNG